MRERGFSIIKWGDIPLFISLISLIIALFLYTPQPESDSSGYFSIFHGDSLLYTNLITDTTLSFKGEVGPLTVEIIDKKLSIKEVFCPHHLCQKRSPLLAGGFPIYCVPNHIAFIYESIQPLDFEVDAIAE